jgi:hypothetical protein
MTIWFHTDSHDCFAFPTMQRQQFLPPPILSEYQQAIKIVNNNFNSPDSPPSASWEGRFSFFLKIDRIQAINWSHFLSDFVAVSSETVYIKTGTVLLLLFKSFHSFALFPVIYLRFSEFLVFEFRYSEFIFLP